MKESDVRKWIKNVWPREPTWTEAAPGGTVGCADCWLPFGHLWVPVELKFWHLDRHGDLIVKRRPAQNVWHMRASKAKSFTCVVAGWDDNGQLALSFHTGEEFWRLGDRLSPGIVRRIHGLADLAAFIRAEIALYTPPAP